MRQGAIRDRIQELRRVKASTLLSHPLNYRQHPQRQKTLLSQLLSEIGYADALLARETPQGLQLLDGHLRRETTPDAIVPVLIVDLNDQEAAKLLATLDPLAGLAETDSAKLGELLDQVDTKGELETWLQERAEQAALFDVSPVDLPDLPTGDKEPFQSLTFTVSDAQAAIIKRALDRAKEEPFGATGNANSNGNALARIAEAYLG